MRRRIPVHLLRKNTHEEEFRYVDFEAAFYKKVGHFSVALLADNVSVLVTLEHANGGILQNNLTEARTSEAALKSPDGGPTFPPADTITFLYVLTLSLLATAVVK